MEKELNGDQHIVHHWSPEIKRTSRGPSGEIEAVVEAMEDTQLYQGPGLRSRKTMASFAGSAAIDMPKDNVFLSEKEETPKVASSPRKEVDDDEVVKVKKVKVLPCIEFFLFFCITLVLILSKTTNKMEKIEIWSLELWKWCGLGLAICCGRLFSKWLMNGIVFFIEKQFMLESTFVYCVKAVQMHIFVLIWFLTILLTWVLLINRGVPRSRHTAKVLSYITKVMISTILFVFASSPTAVVTKKLYSVVQIDKIMATLNECILEKYILQALSGSPLQGDSESIYSSKLPRKQLSFKTTTKDGKAQYKENIIDLEKLLKMKSGTVSDSTITRLVKFVRTLGISRLDKSENVVERDEQRGVSITDEWEARTAGYVTFKKVAKDGQGYIEKDDLLRFMNEDDVNKVLTVIAGEVETGRINKKSFINWTANVYKKHKFLLASLECSEMNLRKLNRFIVAFTILVLTILWFILMGIFNTEVLIFITSQFLFAIFSLGTSFKALLDAIMFVFVKHPFEIGDRCVLDGVQVVVEKVHILTTVFLSYDNEKIFYPNSVLASKAITNFRRSPNMRDTVDFDLDDSTSIEKILALKAEIKKYIYSNPQLWRPKQSVIVREIESVSKMKMTLYVTHTINFQDYELKSERRSTLVLELKKIFEQHKIKYHILPTTSSD